MDAACAADRIKLQSRLSLERLNSLNFSTRCAKPAFKSLPF